MLDWIIQGTHAPFFVAQQKGYFKDSGLNVSIDPGKGAGNVAVSVASNVYNFGWVDLPTMIKFNGQNPSSPLIAVYISFDDTAMAVITLKSKNYRKPADLNGAKIAGGPGTAVHDTISILLKAAKAEDVKINWLPVQPQLFGPMVARGEADGTAGFTNSNIPALLEMGIKLEDIYPIRYADFGADLYGLALVTTKKYAEENPEVVRGMVKALNKGTIDTIKDPEAALKIMKARDADDEGPDRESPARHRARTDEYKMGAGQRLERRAARAAEEDDRFRGQRFRSAQCTDRGGGLYRQVLAAARRAEGELSVARTGCKTGGSESSGPPHSGSSLGPSPGRAETRELISPRGVVHTPLMAVSFICTFYYAS